MQNQEAYSELEMIQGLKNQDGKVLEYIYQAFYPMVLRLVLKNSGDEDDAKDIFQDAIIVVCNKFWENDLVLSCQLKTFVYSVARRLWIKELGKKGRSYGNIKDHEGFLVFSEKDTEQIERREMAYKTMYDALDSLGEPCQTLLKDFYLEGLSMQVISEKFGYTNADNTKNQKYKCFKRLEKLFFKDYKQEE